MKIHTDQVAPGWVDYNGHMNDAAYAQVFSTACDALVEHIGLDQAGRQQHGYTIYTLETHLCYRREAHEGQKLHIRLSLLDSDAKRLHVFFTMHDDKGSLLATSEQMLIGMAQASGHTSPVPKPFPRPIANAVAALPTLDRTAWPQLVGSTIGIRRS